MGLLGLIWLRAQDLGGGFGEFGLRVQGLVGDGGTHTNKVILLSMMDGLGFSKFRQLPVSACVLGGQIVSCFQTRD